MPQFVLADADHLVHSDLDEFTQGYIEAMFFTSDCPNVLTEEFMTPEFQAKIEEGTADGTVPCDVGYTDLDPDTLITIRRHCRRFQVRYTHLLAKAYDRTVDGVIYNERRAGHDLWFTEQGHGVGYWDRSGLDAGGLGDALTEAAGRADNSLEFDGTHVYMI